MQLREHFETEDINRATQSYLHKCDLYTFNYICNLSFYVVLIFTFSFTQTVYFGILSDLVHSPCRLVTLFSPFNVCVDAVRGVSALLCCDAYGEATIRKDQIFSSFWMG